MISRRGTLAVIGGGFVVAAGGFVMTRNPDKALQPWDMAGTYDDVRLDALSYALLAPNPHNLQPWLVELVGDNGVRILRDKDKGLPATDPYDRQVTIGFGCFIEQMTIAASTAGYGVEVTLFPDGEDGPVAQATFREGAPRHTLANAIPSRRSCKEAFADTPVEGSKATALAEFADIYTDAPTVEALRAITKEAITIEMLTAHTMQESIDLMRIGKAEIEANPDGIDLGGAFFDSLKLVGALSRESLADPDSINFQQGLSGYETLMDSTQAYAVLTSAGNTRADQIEAGRRWLRLNLKTTDLGLSLHPVSQCLQEYPEMAEQYASVHALLAEDGQTVQMLGRLGYGPAVPPSPRWPLDAKRLDV